MKRGGRVPCRQIGRYRLIVTVLDERGMVACQIAAASQEVAEENIVADRKRSRVAADGPLSDQNNLRQRFGLGRSACWKRRRTLCRRRAGAR